MSVRLGLHTSHVMKITVYVYGSAILSVRLGLRTCHVMKITVYVYGSAILSVRLGLRTSHVMKITVYGSAILSVFIQVVYRMNTVPNLPPSPQKKIYIWTTSVPEKFSDFFIWYGFFREKESKYILRANWQTNFQKANKATCLDKKQMGNEKAGKAALLWNRIQIGSVFRIFVDPDLYSEYGFGLTQVNLG